MSLRRRCYRFVEKHLRAWELLLALFAAASVYVGVRATLDVQASLRWRLMT